MNENVLHCVVNLYILCCKFHPTAYVVTPYHVSLIYVLLLYVYVFHNNIVCSRKDKSRINAQSRRTTHAQLLKELGSLLPFPEKVIQQIDYNSILRLVLCYFRMKNMAVEDSSSQPNSMCTLCLILCNEMLAIRLLLSSKQYV